jgi:hypothetical protein
MLVSGAADNTLCVWKTDSGELFQRIGAGELFQRIGASGSIGLSAVALSPDARTIALGGGEGTVLLWEVATGHLRHRFEGPKGRVLCLCFSADGRQLLSGSEDGTALLWDVMNHKTIRAMNSPPRAPTELDALWSDLASPDAVKAFRAVCRLAAAPAQAADLIGRWLASAAAAKTATKAQVDRLVDDLDADSFRTRERANKALAALGGSALPILRQKLTEPLSLEAKRRLKQVVHDLDNPFERWRTVRALEVLEGADSPETRKVLLELSRGQPEDFTTQQAKAALDRLAKRSGRE